MFVRSFAIRLTLVAIGIVLLWALFARSSGAAGPEEHYRVRGGDTLWSIAVAHYAGDPREGVWELERRNGLASATIVPGQILTLP